VLNLPYSLVEKVEKEQNNLEKEGVISKDSNKTIPFKGYNHLISLPISL
jgi:hypothetical protein